MPGDMQRHAITGVTQRVKDEGRSAVVWGAKTDGTAAPSLTQTQFAPCLQPRDRLCLEAREELTHAQQACCLHQRPCRHHQLAAVNNGPTLSRLPH